MRLLIRLMALAVVMVFAGACSGSNARDQASQRWDDRIGGDFVLSFETACACPADGYKYHVEFHNDAPLSGSFRSGGRDREVTLLGLELVPTAEELIALADKDGEFDQETGLPLEARRGDVTYRRIRVAFELEVGRAMAEAARLEWDDRDLDDYRLKYRCHRGCGDQGRIQVEWRDGELLGDADTNAPTSVEELLTLVDEALASSPDQVSIRVRKGGLLRGAEIVDAELGILLHISGIRIEPTAVP